MTEPFGCCQTMRTIAALRLFIEAPRSVPELADALRVDVRTARRIVRVLAVGGYLERLPDDAERKRYRVSEATRSLGQRMALADLCWGDLSE